MLCHFSFQLCSLFLREIFERSTLKLLSIISEGTTVNETFLWKVVHMGMMDGVSLYILTVIGGFML
jgi:hypothetical protein